MLNTASAAFSHREGSMVTWVAVQIRGPRNTHRDVLAYADKRLTIFITYTHPDQSIYIIQKSTLVHLQLANSEGPVDT